MKWMKMNEMIWCIDRIERWRFHNHKIHWTKSQEPITMQRNYLILLTELFPLFISFSPLNRLLATFPFCPCVVFLFCPFVLPWVHVQQSMFVLPCHLCIPICINLILCINSNYLEMLYDAKMAKKFCQYRYVISGIQHLTFSYWVLPMHII